jgi:antitoxin HigA-1
MQIRFNEPVPVSPGEVLRDDILAGTGITQDSLAEAMGVSRFTVNQIINGRRAVTADTALRLARVLSTTPDLWLNLQRDVDLWRARRAKATEIDNLPVLRKAQTKFVTIGALVARGKK